VRIKCRHLFLMGLGSERLLPSGAKGQPDHVGGKAYTLVELVVVVVILAVMVLAGLPFFLTTLRSARLDAAVRQFTTDVREARSQATLTGWQYRLAGYNVGGSGTYKNQYRLVGRSSGAVAWPDDTGPSFQSATQGVGPWVDFNRLYPGVRLNLADGTPRFYASFDARGVAFELNSHPFQLTAETGATRTVTVSAAGSVRVQ
jgi:prepilin-type N-terminal cleavage/methylation domain-containing protein